MTPTSPAPSGESEEIDALVKEAGEAVKELRARANVLAKDAALYVAVTQVRKNASLIERLAAALPMWRSMDSAPKGRAILLRVQIGDTQFAAEGIWHMRNWIACLDGEPIAWCDLPPPPTTEPKA